MELNNLKRLLDHLKSIGLLGRIFNWGSVRSQLMDAYADLQRVQSEEDHLLQNLSKSERDLSLERNDAKNIRDTLSNFKSEITTLKESLQRTGQEKQELQKRIATLEEKNAQYLDAGLTLRKKTESQEAELQLLREENTKFRTTEAQRSNDYELRVASIQRLSDRIQKERNDEVQEIHQKEIERLSLLEETWSKHEENVKNRIKTICNRHGIEYVDKVPFKGSPDNTLRIKDEYIVFDAKSPRGEDLSNFQSAYLKNQVESAIKYVKEEEVRKEVFLVVPTNTLEVIEQFEYRLADYTVYIISIDALEPIILALKKIEEYEFAEQLSPEERENICRVIGKFVHLSKRRIQIDGFFAKQFFELVYRSDADLPKDFLDKVVEFEKSEKLNPPLEKRAKQISTKELEADSNKIASEARQKGIITQDSLLSKEFNKLPLYSTEDPKDEDQGKLFP